MTGEKGRLKTLFAAFSKRVIVLDHGALIADGDAQTILNTPAVVTAYLGKRKQA
jgi:branched-chain amino acid transport system ATP-binding protein